MAGKQWSHDSQWPIRLQSPCPSYCITLPGIQHARSPWFKWLTQQGYSCWTKDGGYVLFKSGFSIPMCMSTRSGRCVLAGRVRRGLLNSCRWHCNPNASLPTSLTCARSDICVSLWSRVRAETESMFPGCDITSGWHAPGLCEEPTGLPVCPT